MKFSSSPFKPIFRQLLIGVGVSLTVVGFGATWVNYRVVSRDLEYQVNKRATAITQSLQLSSEGFIELGYFPMLERVVTNYASLPDVLEVAIVNPQGKTISHSSVVEINRPFGEIHPTLEEFVQQASETGEVQGRSFRLNGQPVFLSFDIHIFLMFVPLTILSSTITIFFPFTADGNTFSFFVAFFSLSVCSGSMKIL